MKIVKRSLKYFLPFVLTALFFVGIKGFGQTVSPTCTYVPCYAFNNLDNKQIWYALMQLNAKTSGSTVITGTVPVSDFTADSITLPLRSTRRALYDNTGKSVFINGSGGSNLFYSGASVAEWAGTISSWMDDGNNGVFLIGSGSPSVFKNTGNSVFVSGGVSEAVINDSTRALLRRGLFSDIDTPVLKDEEGTGRGKSVFKGDDTGYSLFKTSAGASVFNSNDRSIAVINDSVNTAVNRFDRHVYGVNITPQTYGYETWGEAQINSDGAIIGSLTSIDGKLLTGQQSMVNSLAVVLPADQVVSVTASQSPTTIVYSQSITPVASASVVLAIAPSVAAYLDKITISGTQTTGGPVLFKVMTLTTSPTGGSFTNPTGFELETGASVSNSTDVKFFTANPTGGGAVSGGTGIMSQAFVPIVSVTNQGLQEYVFDFLANPKIKQPVVSTSRIIALALEGVTLTGGRLNITVQLSR